ncbi:MAG: IPT/TIG domain-containing protein [Acidobacteriota bacterium]
MHLRSYFIRPVLACVLLLAPALCHGQGYVSTVAGTGANAYFGENLSAISAGLQGPQGLAFDSEGNLYFADGGSRIRKIDTSGLISTVAGSPTPAPKLGFSGDGGPATEAALLGTGIYQGIALDTAGNIYIADILNHRIRKVDTNGIINTVAGSGQVLGTGSLFNPHGVAVDSAGNLYIADTSNSRIKKVTPAGVTTTIAGTGTQAFTGDGGPAASAAINQPRGIMVDAAGNVYFSDMGNFRVRKIDTSGMITTVAGSGTLGFAGDGGPATSARLNTPLGLALDGQGNLYICDSGNDRIRKVDPSGTITTAVGNGAPVEGFADGKLATATRLFAPKDVAIGPDGNLYFSDYGFNRIRKVTPNPPPVSVVGNVSAVSFVAALNQSALPVLRVNLTSSGTPLSITSTLAFQSGANWLTATLSGGTTPATVSLSASATGLAAGVYDATVTITPAGAQNIPLVVYVTLTVNPATIPPTAPKISTGGVVNGASFAAAPAPIAPGALISIFGTNMSTTTAGAASLPLPTALGGTQVLMNGQLARLIFVSPGQINAQAPWELAGSSSVNVRVVNSGVPSNTVTNNTGPAGPGIFTVAPTTAGIVTHGADGSLVTAANPAARGEIVVVYATGLGPVSNTPASGNASPGGPLARLIGQTIVTFGSSQFGTVLFSGLAPGFVGLFQVNVQVPAASPVGDNVQLQIIAGTVSNTVTIAVR